ncbi:hypothetical protein D2E26_0951 [Bifidobacterium dolichotidis]|uniref:DUF3267 domain-containing protein n=1 Tax=Bifidobacterium dolichotidis TaxID=2306976 RepID=A0A430FPY6_9BIFI|nr:hypothetical protein [Bifidobacterium dolichotidis]RSX54897.1 hypothetical protein D2E26_0951 [Bifidobacterium dolichotidis]
MNTTMQGCEQSMQARHPRRSHGNRSQCVSKVSSSSQYLRSPLLRVIPKIVVACFAPFIPVYVLAAIQAIWIGANGIVTGFVIFALCASLAMFFHELMHAVVLCHDIGSAAIQVKMHLFCVQIQRDKPQTSGDELLCAVLGPLAGVLTAVIGIACTGAPWFWLLIIQQALCLMPFCDDGMVALSSIATMLLARRQQLHQEK